MEFPACQPTHLRPGPPPQESSIKHIRSRAARKGLKDPSPPRRIAVATLSGYPWPTRTSFQEP